MTFGEALSILLKANTSAPTLIDLISDSFTLIVGFVAIGIPLAIQVAERSSERYDNNLLVEKLTKGAFVTPIRIILLSVFYIILSQLIKLSIDGNFLPLHKDIATPFINTGVIIAGIVFTTILVSSAWFYIRLYLRVTSPTTAYIEQFLQLNKNKTLLLLKDITEKVVAKLSINIKSYLPDYASKPSKIRFKHSHISSVDAGLELLIEYLQTKSWEQSGVELLFAFDRKISNDYFGKDDDRILNNIDVRVIKSYWSFLCRLIRVSRENEVAKLCFHSQRLLGHLAARIINHAQYQDMVGESYTLSNDDKITLHTDIYEIARWQGNLENNGIDLVLEGEWSKDIFGIFASPTEKTDPEAATATCRLWLDIAKLALDRKPDKIINLYKNLSEASNYKNENKFFYTYSKTNQDWLNDFWDNFNNLPKRLSSFPDFITEKQRLIDGESFQEYRLKLLDFRQSPLEKDQVKDIDKSIDLSSIFKTSIFNECKFVGWQLTSYLAFYDKWEPLYECLIWNNPPDTNVSYCGDSILPESLDELCNTITNGYNFASDNSFFIEHHNMLVFALRAWLFQIIYFHEKSQRRSSLSFKFQGDLNSINKHKKIIKGLISQSDNIRDNGVFSPYQIGHSVSLLERTLKSISEYEISFIANAKLDTIKWNNFKITVEEGWNSDFFLEKLFNVNYSKDVMSNQALLLKQSTSKTDYMRGNGISIGGTEIYGKHAAQLILSHVYCASKKLAVSGTNLVASNKVIFASKTRLASLGFDISSIHFTGYVYDSSLNSFGVLVNTDDVLVVCRTATTIELTSNISANTANNPLFIINEEISSSKLEIRISAYFEIRMINSHSIERF